MFFFFKKKHQKRVRKREREREKWNRPVMAPPRVFGNRPMAIVGRVNFRVAVAERFLRRRQTADGGAIEAGANNGRAHQKLNFI